MPAASNNFQRDVRPHGFGSVDEDRDDRIMRRMTIIGTV